MHKHALLLGTWLLISVSALAQTAPIAPNPNEKTDKSLIEKRLLTHLQSTYPKHSVREVVASPVTNLFHVVIGTDVATLAVTDETLERLKANAKLTAGEATRYWIMGGRFFDSESALDLRAPLKVKAEKIDVQALEMRNAIIEIRGTPKNTLYVFTDPMCPFCQRLHEELKTLQNIKIVTFLTPLATLHPASPEVAARIYCAKNPTVAMDAAFKDADRFLKETPKAACETPIERNLSSMKALFIKGTPTLFLENGERLVGYQSRDVIEKALAKLKNNTKEAP